MTIKNLYPDSRPQSIYNVINGRPELPAASTYSQASDTWNFNSEGNLQKNDPNVPRFEYDPNTGEFVGLLLEGETQNRIQNSETFNAYVSPGRPDLEAVSKVTYDLDLPYDPTSTAGARISVMHEVKIFTSPVNEWIFTSIYVKKTKSRYIVIHPGKTGFNTSSIAPVQNCLFVFDFDTGTETRQNKTDLHIKKLSNGWFRLGFYAKLGNTYTSNGLSMYSVLDSFGASPNIQNPVPDDIRDINGEFGLSCLSSYVIPDRYASVPQYLKNLSANPIKAADQFSLTSSNDFDGGFSLLLDSDTTTEDFLYRIKANGSTIASLSNVAGTLDWNVNGTSAANSTPPLYPQVGFVNGRVRTVSSFGAADGEIQNNYLYTTGLSFPTPAEVAPGADELEFGTPQTLKALYLWNGQLSDTEAVSVIKGEYNVVPNEPIKTDSYSFVYNTDPENVGKNSITLPYIVPTVSMRVYWGDGTNQRYEQGADPSHTYPYPGQYRIQITADDGFDRVTLSDIQSTITRVDQWAPQHRVGASGPGFTKDDMVRILPNQPFNKQIPPFEYTDLTDLDNAFASNSRLNATGWDWVPTNLTSATNLYAAFKSLTYYIDADRDNFPQLVTSDKLLSVGRIFENTFFKKFPEDKPLTDTSKVTNFYNAFRNCRLTALNLDTKSAITLQGAFEGNQWVTSPSMDVSNCTNFQDTWRQNSFMVTMLPLDVGNGSNFTSCWRDCVKLENFPNLDFGNCQSLNSAWYRNHGITAAKPFPNLDLTNATSFNTAWYECVNMTSFPDQGGTFPNVTSASSAWQNCTRLTSFPALKFPVLKNAPNAWYNCALEAFPADFEMPEVTNLEQTWRGNMFESFPALDISKAVIVINAWMNCRNLKNFPAGMFDAPREYLKDGFDNTFRNCALTPQSVENIFVSIVAGGSSDLKLDIYEGDNAPRYAGSSGTSSDSTSWTSATETAFQTLLTRGWTITYNKYVGVQDTLPVKFRIFHGPDTVHFIETTATVESGQPNQEEFTDEVAAIDRILELDKDFFPEWDREAIYDIGDRVKFGDFVYRALQENDLRSFELPDLEFNPDAEVATPANRQARWVEVYDPNYEEESYGGPI